jgi:hypothetical protein
MSALRNKKEGRQTEIRTAPSHKHSSQQTMMNHDRESTIGKQGKKKISDNVNKQAC